MKPLSPMRPAIQFPRLDEWTGTLPDGWDWQVKLDDERASWEFGILHNRHGQPIAGRKAAPWMSTLALLDGPLDLALLGYRTLRGFAVVVLDLPAHPGIWAERQKALAERFPEWDPLLGLPAPEVCRLRTHPDGRALFLSTHRKPGVEGVIGRRLSAHYQAGDSRDMAKSKWKR